ncbi:hypothetical protein [Eubacterium uniforme]|uniref:5-bromo-4-chloroindolyl phosphate hydrolysis protein n=1 Tax=Eubacterium uniforme TaxID=39495 RepID=A0A1T4VMH4_9FIRM|nr:hypothetical protein [Eubacterium uniforme]SKA66137.1 hypothetical protein SAMN02745111_01231 [Eubacterium uniforme]HAH19192.1 hypothetical protein [Eubacterium sp.]HAV90989.1 hypothetical protein [Eubacterium sp.]
MNKTFKLIFLNLSIIIIAILSYSPGFFYLRPSDVSVFRAGMSIIIFLALLLAFCYGNYSLLKPKEKVTYSKENIKDMSEAKSILSSYTNGEYFGEIATTVISQISRLESSTQRAKIEIGRKFERGSLSWQKYYSAIEEANSIALDNVISLANRIQFFDESEYSRLKKYKYDAIPDDIQMQQLELYNTNMKLIESAVSVNENLILGLDRLSIEFAKPGEIEEQNINLLTEIKKLTDEVKYYV